MSCQLCHSMLPLRKSHILPEFVYRPAYDASHTTTVLDAGRGTSRKRQKGFTERLLCENCESKLSKWETYFANVWFNPASRVRPQSLHDDLIVVPGLDYAKFKLFHLSILWRAGIAGLPEFQNVHLGGQAEKIRLRLLDEDPGEPHEYPFFGMAFRDPISGGFQDGLIKAPDAARANGFWIYTIVFGGVLWHYVASEHARTAPVPVRLEKSGDLTLGVQDWTDNIFVKGFAAKLQLAKKARNF